MDMENAYQLSVGGSEVRRITKDDTLIWQRAVETGASESDVFSSTRDSQTLGADILGNCLQQETPEGITQLDGIISQSKYQYINTKVIGNSAKFKVRIEVLFTEACIPTTTGNNYFAGTGTNSRMNLCINKDLWVAYFVESSEGGALDGGGFTAELDKYYNIEITANTADSTATLDATDDAGTSVVSKSVEYTPATTISNPFALFRQATSVPYAGGFKIRRATFWKDDVMVADFVACKTSSGTIGMYELVKSYLATNVGTGVFTAGDVISPTPAKPIEIQEVGDKSINLINSVMATVTQNGITATNNGDGSYTLNGTATANTWLNITGNMTSPLTVGSQYKLLGLSADTGDASTRLQVADRSGGTILANDSGQKAGGTFTYTDPNNLGTVAVQVRIASGYTFNNFVIKPMITANLSATYDDFEPYGKYSVPVVRYSKNRFDGPAHIDTITYPEIGITFTNLGDGGVHIGGAATETATAAFAGKNNYGNYGLYLDGVKPGDTITVYGCVLQATASVSGGGLASVDAVSGPKTFTIPDWTTTICLAYRITSGITYDVDLYPIIAKGTYAELPFTPYIAPVTQKVFIDAPLRKVGDYADELVVNGNTAQVTRNVGEMDVATATWWLSSSPTRWISKTGTIPNIYGIGDVRGTNILAEQYPIKTDDTTPSMFQYATRLYCYNGSETETPTGNVLYRLATPTTETATVSGEIDLVKNIEYSFEIESSLDASKATLKYLGEN